MEIELFKIQNYKTYIHAMIRSYPKNGHGIRSKLAQHIGCQTSYLSQILNGPIDLTLEQAETMSGFFRHSEEEKHFFLLLVELEKAGTKGLKDFFKNQIEKILKNRLVLKERIKSQTEISVIDQTTYYSSWIYSAVYVMLSISQFRTKSALVDALKLPVERVNEVLKFLVSCGLAREEKGHYKINPSSLHLSHDSPLISKHHTNWRMQAIVSLDHPHDEDLHYSTIFSISEKDAVKIKSLLVDAISEANKIMSASPEEAVRGFCLDFFSPIYY